MKHPLQLFVARRKVCFTHEYCGIFVILLQQQLQNLLHYLIILLLLVELQIWN